MAGDDQRDRIFRQGLTDIARSLMTPKAELVCMDPTLEEGGFELVVPLREDPFQDAPQRFRASDGESGTSRKATKDDEADVEGGHLVLVRSAPRILSLTRLWVNFWT